MGWLFVPDARPEAGGGHLRRCLALAREVARRMPVSFAIAGEPSVREALQAEGFAVVEQDQARTIGGWAGCVLDGYGFSDADLAAWKIAAERVVVIDDVGHRPATADLVVAPATREKAAHVVAGLDHALLDGRFAAPSLRSAPSSVKRILVCFGRRDGRGGCALALQALSRMPIEGAEVTVVVGPDSPALLAIREAAAGTPQGRVTVRTDVEDMLPLLRDADLAVIAGGVGLLECAAAGVPAVVVTTAENQRAQTEMLAQGGAALDLGDLSQVTADRLGEAVAALAGDCHRRETMSARARAMVDGRGAERVARRLLEGCA